MADVTRAIEIIFGAVDETSAVMGKISDGFDKFASNLEDVTSPLATITEGLLALEAAAAVAAVAVIGFSINAAGQFQQSLTEIHTLLLNVSDEDFAKFQQAALEFGATSASSFDQVTEALYRAVSGTGDLDSALELVNAAEKLAIAGRADLNDVTLLLSTTLNAYGLNVTEATRVSDALFTAVQIGQTTIPQLASGLDKVTASASSLGIPIEEIAASFGILTSRSIPTEQAATGLAAAFQNIIHPSETAKAAAEELGIQFNETGVQTQGWSGLLAELTQKTGGSATELGKFFGSAEGLKVVLALTKDETEGLANAITLIGNNSGVTQKAYELMVNTIGVQTQILQNALQAAAITIGADLLQPFLDVESAITKLFNAIRASADAGAFDPLIQVAKDALLAIAATIEEVAQNLPTALALVDFTGFASALRELGEAVGSIFTGVDLSTPEGLAAVLQKVVNISEGLVNVTIGIVDAVRPVIQQFAEWASTSDTLSKDAEKLIGNILSITTQINLLLPAVGSTVKAFEGLALVMAGKELREGFNFLIKAAGVMTFTLGSVAAVATLIGAAALLSYWITKLIVDFFGITPALAGFTDKIAQYINGPSLEVLKQLQAMGQHLTTAQLATIKTADASSVLFGKLQDGTGPAGGFNSILKDLGISTGAFGAEAEAAVPPIEKASAAIEKTAQNLGLLKNPADTATVSIEGLANVQFKLGNALGPLGTALIAAQQSTEKYAFALRDTDDVSQAFLDSSEKLKNALGLSAQAAQDAVAGGIRDYLETVRESGGVTRDAALASDLAAKGYESQIIPVTDLETGVVRYTQALVFSGDAATEAADKAEQGLSKTAQELLDAQKEANDFQLAWEQIASDERSLVFQLTADIAIAEIEAGTARIQAAFESIDNTITSTGETITELAKIFADVSGSKSGTILDLLEEENRRREEALQLQKELVQANIDYLRAVVDRLSGGEAFITVTGDGLEPELEAFMFKILARIQVKASAEAQQFLLGLG